MDEIKTSNGGSITYHNYKDGVEYAIYVPKSVTPNTQIFTYTYGSNGQYGWRKIFDTLIENDSNSIIIMPSMAWNDDWGSNTIEIVNNVRNEYGITNLNISSAGFSMGGFGGTVTVAENIRQNPNIDPQVVFLIDDYSEPYHSIKDILNSNGRTELFTENNTIFFAYCLTQKKVKNYQTYLDAGLNVINVEPKEYGHIAIKENFFKNGIYDYMAGASLPKDGYIYRIYNKETGNWEEIEYDKISTINKLYDYYNIDILQSKISKLSSLSGYVIKSDSGLIEQYLNNMVATIKRASFLNTPVDSFGGSSTTNAPSQIPSCIHNYLSNVAKTVDKLTVLMDAVAKIDPAYQEADQNLLAMINNQDSNL